jgi:hypothetical protein
MILRRMVNTNGALSRMLARAIFRSGLADLEVADLGIKEAKSRKCYHGASQSKRSIRHSHEKRHTELIAFA